MSGPKKRTGKPTGGRPGAPAKGSGPRSASGAKGAPARSSGGPKGASPKGAPHATGPKGAGPKRGAPAASGPTRSTPARAAAAHERAYRLTPAAETGPRLLFLRASVAARLRADDGGEATRVHLCHAQVLLRDYLADPSLTPALRGAEQTTLERVDQRGRMAARPQLGVDEAGGPDPLAGLADRAVEHGELQRHGPSIASVGMGELA